MQGSHILSMEQQELFPMKREQELKREYHRLSMIWHPDRNKSSNAAAIFAHIHALYTKAVARSIPPEKEFVRENGTKFTMKYMMQSRGEGCDIYIGSSSVAYIVAADHLSDRASARKWKFSSSKMESEVGRYLPHLRREEKLSGGRLTVWDRAPDQILMRDMINANNGKIEPVHVYWMITRMMNLSCYLEWANIAHLSITPEYLLVCPEAHSVSLTGPALYAVNFGQRPEFAPARTVSIIPALKNKNFEASSVHDRMLIRKVGLELLGDPSGNRIRSDPNIRPEVVKWLNSPPPASAVEDYEAWEGCLGVRKFVHYPQSAKEMYEIAVLQ